MLCYTLCYYICLLLVLVQMKKSEKPAPEPEKKSKWRKYDENFGNIEFLNRAGFIKTERIFEAMISVERTNFIELEMGDIFDPIDIGFGATFSHLQMQAFMLEALEKQLKEGAAALDVGCGTGYLTTCMAYLVGEKGHVIGIDHIKELVKNATERIKIDKPTMVESGRVKMITGDGRLGVPKERFNAILVGAVGDKVPRPLLTQLKRKGRLAMPILNTVEGQEKFQMVRIIDRLENGSFARSIITASFYEKPCEPLGDMEKQILRGSVVPTTTVRSPKY